MLFIEMSIVCHQDTPRAFEFARISGNMIIVASRKKCRSVSLTLPLVFLAIISAIELATVVTCLASFRKRVISNPPSNRRMTRGAMMANSRAATPDRDAANRVPGNRRVVGPRGPGRRKERTNARRLCHPDRKERSVMVSSPTN